MGRKFNLPFQGEWGLGVAHPMALPWGRNEVGFQPVGSCLESLY